MTRRPACARAVQRLAALGPVVRGQGLNVKRCASGTAGVPPPLSPRASHLAPPAGIAPASPAIAADASAYRVAVARRGAPPRRRPARPCAAPRRRRRTPSTPFNRHALNSRQDGRPPAPGSGRPAPPWSRPRSASGSAPPQHRAARRTRRRRGGAFRRPSRNVRRTLGSAAPVRSLQTRKASSSEVLFDSQRDFEVSLFPRQKRARGRVAAAAAFERRRRRRRLHLGDGAAAVATDARSVAAASRAPVARRHRLLDVLHAELPGFWPRRARSPAPRSFRGTKTPSISSSVLLSPSPLVPRRCPT